MDRSHRLGARDVPPRSAGDQGEAVAQGGEDGRAGAAGARSEEYTACPVGVVWEAFW